MSLRLCRVTFCYMEGVKHSVEVTASTLYEAVALALKALGSHDFVEGLKQGSVTVSVQNVAVDHTIKLKEFQDWLKRRGGSPAERIRRTRVKEILGIPE